MIKQTLPSLPQTQTSTNQPKDTSLLNNHENLPSNSLDSSTTRKSLESLLSQSQSQNDKSLDGQMTGKSTVGEQLLNTNQQKQAILYPRVRFSFFFKILSRSQGLYNNLSQKMVKIMDSKVPFKIERTIS